MGRRVALAIWSGQVNNLGDGILLAAMDALMTLILHYQLPQQPPVTFRAADNEVIIGRIRDARVHLNLAPDLKVSRIHARLFYHLDAWWVEDLGSKQGTYCNGQRIVSKTPLGDDARLKVGDTVLTVELQPTPELSLNVDDGLIGNTLTLHETLPPDGIAESERVALLAQMSRIAQQRQGQARLDGFIEEILRMLPHATRASILLNRDQELLPIASWPSDQSYASMTLAQRAIDRRIAIAWERTIASDASQTIPSLRSTVAALYAPILHNRRVIGVLQVDSTSLKTRFSDMDLKYLSDAATTIGRTLEEVNTDHLYGLPSVFISYAHEDTAFIRTLANDLRRRQVSVWFDERLHPGQDWQVQLASAIRAVDALVLVMSPPCVTSPYVRWEIDHSKAEKKPIFPLLYRPCIVPPDLANIQYIKIGEAYNNGLTRLVDALRE